MMQSKIHSLEQLVTIAQEQRQAGKQLVFTNGCFDLLHIGHVRYLQHARELGDCLIVGLNSDRSVQSLGKGEGRPIINEQERAEVLAALSCVDFITVFDAPDPLSLIQTLIPHILVKGEDWAPEQIIGRDVVESHGGSVVSIPLVPNSSTSRIVERILNLRSTFAVECSPDETGTTQETRERT